MDAHLRSKIDLFLQRADLVTAMIMAAAFPFSFALFNVGIVILIISFFVKRFLRGDFSLFDLLIDCCMVSFYIIALLSFFSSSYPSMTLQGAHKLGRYLLLFIASREILKSFKDVQWIVLALLTGAGITCLDAILQYVLGTDPLRGQTVFLGFNNLIRLTACFPNPNALSIYLSALFPLAFCIARYGKLGRKAFCGALLLIAGLLYCLFYTYARAAVIVLGVNMVLICLIKKDKTLPLIFLVVGTAGILSLQGEVKNWVMHLHSLKDFLVDQTRYYHQHAALNMIAAKPWFGVGLNTFDINYGAYRLAGDPFTRWSAHQGYLQLAAENGLLGLTAFLSLIFAIVRYAWKSYPQNELPWVRAAFLGLAGGFLSFLISGFFESLFWQPRQANFFWFWAGILCAAAKIVSQKNSSENRMVSAGKG